MNRRHLSGIILISLPLLLLVPLGETVTSPSSSCTLECCQGCVVNTYSTQSRKKTTCLRQSRPTRYSTDCGFWGWSRCTRYRTSYYTQCTDRNEYYIGVKASCKPSCSCVDPPQW